MVDLGLAGFFFGMLTLGLRRPFIWVLTYLYVDIVSPQKISYFLLASLPVSLIAFIAAFSSWLFLDDKRDSRFTFRQVLLLFLLVYCGLTTLSADFAVEALNKWEWVWKALVFAIFLPLTLRTRLRFEVVVLTMVLSAGSIIITGAIKTLASGGGYGALKFFVNDNTGLYEGSIISCVAISIIPLIAWLMKHGTIFPPDRKVKLFCLALIFACLLIPVGTQARTGLMCIGLLGVLTLRSVKRRFLYISVVAVLSLIAIPLLPESYTKRMSMIENHSSDQSASTRMAVWAWTWDYAKSHPMGGGFEAYRQNKLNVELTNTETSGNTTAVAKGLVADKARAYHSSYFEMLGEQGWPGLLVWLLLQVMGIWQMEVLRRRWTKRAAEPDAEKASQWQAPLANALQQAQVIYLLGAAFVGIAYQPFILMLIAIQCGLWSYLERYEKTKNAARIAIPLRRELQV